MSQRPTGMEKHRSWTEDIIHSLNPLIVGLVLPDVWHKARDTYE